MGLDVQHVPALRLCLPHEDRHPGSWSTMRAQAGRAKAPQGHPGLLRHGAAQRNLQRHGRLARGFHSSWWKTCWRSTAKPSRSFEDAGPGQQAGRQFFLNQNSREPVTEPDEMVPLWKILHLVGADWTYGTKGWAAENYCMFLADDESWKHIVATKVKAVEDWGARSGSTPSEGTNLRSPGRTAKIQHRPTWKSRASFQYYAQWIREGKLKVNSDWNKDRKIKFTVQDPCQLVRKSFGDPVADDLRYVVKAVVGEENFIDMTPTAPTTYCCGGGGGFLQSGYNEERREYGNSRPTRSFPPAPSTASPRATTATPRSMIWPSSAITRGRPSTCGPCCASLSASSVPTSASTWVTTSGKSTFSIRKAKCRTALHLKANQTLQPIPGCGVFL
jgi:hypothetical protein